MEGYKLEWDLDGERLYETGVSKGVLYPITNGVYGKGVAWNGLSAVNESPSGGESNPIYADNIKYLDLTSAEEFGLTIEAYMSPEEFDECDGSKSIAKGVIVHQQNRKPFGFSYVTLIGNDTNGTDHGYKTHLVYGCKASPAERSHGTVNESPEAATLSWTVTTTSVKIPGAKPTAHIEIDSTKVDKEALARLESILYGSDTEEPRLPLPDELMTIFNKNTEAAG